MNISIVPKLEDKILEGIAELDVGKGIPGEQVFADLKAHIATRQRTQKQTRRRGIESIGRLSGDRLFVKTLSL